MKRIAKILFFSFLILGNTSANEIIEGEYYTPVVIDGVVYDTDLVASLITIITTTDPIPSIPSTKHIYNSTKSLFRIPAFAKCKKVIVFDGIKPENMTENLKAAYAEYKQAIERLTETDVYFSNTTLVFCEEWGHLSGALREAVKYVTTPFIFIHQHDFDLIKDFDLNGLIASMVVNPRLKHVRLNHFKEAKAAPLWYGDIDDVIEGPHFVPLIRLFGWSDPEHVSRLDYYTDYVLPSCLDKLSMEYYMNEAEHHRVFLMGKEGHERFGTYLYGGWYDGPYIQHTDGREAWTGPDLLTPKQ